MSGWDAELNLPSKLNPPSKLNLPLNQVLGLVLVLGVFVPDWNGFGFAVKKTLNREKQKSQVLPIVALNGIYARALTLKSVSLPGVSSHDSSYRICHGYWVLVLCLQNQKAPRGNVGGLGHRRNIEFAHQGIPPLVLARGGVGGIRLVARHSHRCACRQNGPVTNRGAHSQKYTL